MVRKKMIGKAHNFSLDGKKPVRGWYLLIAKNGEEFLVRRNFRLPWYGFQEVYQTGISLAPIAILNSVEIKNRSFLGVGIGIAIAPLVRMIVPMELIFGESNLPINVLEGVYNIFGLSIIAMLAFFITSFYRYKKVESYIQKQGGKLSKLGYIKSNQYLTLMANGRELW